MDRPASLARLRGLAGRVLHLAPPPPQGEDDPRTRALLGVLRRRPWRRARHTGAPGQARYSTRAGRAPAFEPGRAARPALVYASTSGVYGDLGGARVDETRRLSPTTPRARRRVAAERAVRRFGAAAGWRAGIVRIPIYAAERLPLARLARGARAGGAGIYTNHIHADDLARVLVAALFRGRPSVSSTPATIPSCAWATTSISSPTAAGCAPPRLRAAAGRAGGAEPAELHERESRRLDNTRLKRELRVRLRYPTVADFLGT